ncbi:hypothetical protein DNTS_006396 [Danionella cerebrum]|uniref:Uncharacterized protein n=1 Tax=Danionella cerebrum TaxID=2873325 RepID=A0A553NGX0_9TELE|nr:hypothetical protein DNTS_006396 [Danionella translucida]
MCFPGDLCVCEDVLHMCISSKEREKEKCEKQRDNPTLVLLAPFSLSLFLCHEPLLLSATGCVRSQQLAVFHSMFSWVIKVVPQPPVAPGTLGEDDKTNDTARVMTKKEEVNQDASKEELSEENSGMLTWLSHGFSSALPQPANSSKLPNSELQEGNAVSSRAGMIGWIVQGLGKVVPQPDEKYKGHTEPEDVTEPAAVPVVKVDPPVQEVKRGPEQVPDIPVVEVMSDEEPEVVNVPFSPRVMDWLKQGLEKVVPQSPLHLHPPSAAETPAQRALPHHLHLLSYQKQHLHQNHHLHQNQYQFQLQHPHLHNQHQNQYQLQLQHPHLHLLLQSQSHRPSLGRMMPQPVLKAKDENCDIVQNVCILQDPCDMVLEELEDEDLDVEAEAQPECSVPRVEIIQTEEDQIVITDLEERLQQEHVEAARIAEKLARQAAEMAIRCLEEEQNAQNIIQTEDADNEDQLQHLAGDSEEEEEEEDSKNSESLADVCPAEPSPHESEISLQTPQSPPVPPVVEKTVGVSPPVTTQPERTTTASPGAAEEDEPPDEGCGVPHNCNDLKSWILRIPHASACLSSFKMPSDLMLISQLPKQANMCFQNALQRLNSLNPL